MKRFIVKLKCGNHAIIQSLNFTDLDNVQASIGIILPNRKIIEFLDLSNWIASYKGHSKSVKSSLINIYKNNKDIIKKKIMYFNH